MHAQVIHLAPCKTCTGTAVRAQQNMLATLHKTVLQAGTKKDFMTGFSSADQSPLLRRVQGRWRPIDEENILTKVHCF